MTEFDNFPHEINRMIGSYLDYNSRLEFGQLVSDIEDRPVKKINADSHQTAIHIISIKNRIRKVEKLVNWDDKGYLILDLVKFIINKHDTTLVFEYSKFRNWIIRYFKTRYSDDYWDNPFFYYIRAPITDAIVKETRILLEKLENYKPKLNYELIPKLVEIK